MSSSLVFNKCGPAFTSNHSLINSHMVTVKLLPSPSPLHFSNTETLKPSRILSTEALRRGPMQTILCSYCFIIFGCPMKGGHSCSPYTEWVLTHHHAFLVRGLRPTIMKFWDRSQLWVGEVMVLGVYHCKWLILNEMFGRDHILGKVGMNKGSQASSMKQ